MELGESAALGARRGHAHAVVRTINVLVGDDDFFLVDASLRQPGQRS
jgi:hypothetical protein